MKKLMIVALLSTLSGCGLIPTKFDRDRQKLEQDVEILELKVRKAKLVHKLETIQDD